MKSKHNKFKNVYYTGLSAKCGEIRRKEVQGVYEQMRLDSQYLNIFDIICRSMYYERYPDDDWDDD